MDGALLLVLGASILGVLLLVLVGFLFLYIIADCCLKTFKSEAVQVEAPAAALTAPQSCDHRTDPSLTISRTHPEVLQTTPIYQPQYTSDNPELESGRHVADYQNVVPIDHDSYTADYTTLPPQTMENTVDISPTNDAPPPYKVLFQS